MNVLLTPAEVAAILGRPVSFVHALSRAGALAYYEVGRQRRYREEDVVAYLDRTYTP